jgi:hypothetical protein
MSRPKNHYWFLAKRYGWGWGLPVTWQGWLFLLLWLGLLVGGAGRLLPARPFIFALFMGCMTGVLVLVCYLTGEPPRWRWRD